MSKAATLDSTAREAHYRAQAERYLAETNYIIKRLASERSRHERRRGATPDIVEEVKAILRGT